MSLQSQTKVESPRDNVTLGSEQFEVANNGQSSLVKMSLHSADNAVSQSTQPSPTIAPIDHNSMSPLADTIGELNQLGAPRIVTPNGSSLTKGETPILDGTLTIPSRHLEGTTAYSTHLTESSREHLLDDQYETIAFQQGTPKFLAGSIVDLKERQGDVLKKRFQAVTEESETQIDSQAAMEEQIKELNLQLRYQIRANADMEEKFHAVRQENELLLASRAESALASNNAMGHQLYQFGIQVGKRDAELADLRAKLVAAHRRIADLSAAPVEQPEPTPDLSSKKQEINNLTRQLDEMCAKYHEEKDCRDVAEEQLRCLKMERSGDQSSVNEKRIVKELRNKVEQLDDELDCLRHRFEEVNDNMMIAVQDADDQREIVHILREEHAEGIRLIAERDQKIASIEKILRGLKRST